MTNPGVAGLSPGGGEALAALADPRALRYEPDPRGLPAAREAVASYLGGRAGAAPDPAHIFLTASTSEAYAHLFRLLCDPGDEVLIPRPSYPLLEPIARLEDVGTHGYRLVYDGAWRLDPDSLEASLTPRTRAIVLVEPNNPTGSLLSPEEFALVESVCRERGLALIVDEVFGDIAWPARGAPLPSRLGGRSVPTFVLGGISKPCGLPQLKLGWIAADGPEARLAELLPGLDWILDLFLSVGTPVQWALPKLLELRHPYQAALKARIGENLEVIARAEKRHAGALLPYRGEGGLSAVLRVRHEGGGPAAGEELAEWALRERDVYVHPAHFYELDRDDLVVVSLLTPPGTMAEALNRIMEG
jgi:alanine-synthesizing transaminase